MRLHQLSATAFGPFVDTVYVDFDELSAGGVFLLTGDTGAGKTSVLDAVCFALYGEVPGDRHTARHLRSDQADAATSPRVTLELTVGRRTFRFTRSPAWERPKKRGAGTIRVQAHVVVEELRDGTWTTLTNRLDEAGQLVTGLLGMTCGQFTQVAMLPQNRFQAFLRASSSERQAVLQRLFRTERFEAVERWLVERRVTLRRESQSCQERVAAVVNRFQEAAGTAVPEEWDVHDLAPRADDGSLLVWAGETHLVAEGHAEAGATAFEAAASDCAKAQEQLDEAREVAGRRRLGLEARRTLRELDLTGAAEQQWQRQLADHHRAAPVVPLVRRAGLATRALDDAEEDAASHRAALTELLGIEVGAVDPALIGTAATRSAEERAVAESWLPREDELRIERERTTALARDVEELSARAAATGRDLGLLAPRRQQLMVELDRHQQLAARLGERQTRVDQVETALQAALDARALGRQLGDKRHALAEANRVTLDLREEHLDLREARISGMAAELATGLAVGCSCPVCGSAEHPFPATASQRVTRDDEESARQRHETAAFEQQVLQESVTTLETQLQTAILASEGHRAPYWERRQDEARAAVDAAARAVERVTEMADDLAALDASERELSNGVATTRAALAERSAALKAAMIRRDALERELGALMRGHDVTSVSDLVTVHAERHATLTTALEALGRLDRARTDREAAVAEAVAAASDAGFDSSREALASHLAAEVAARLEADLGARLAARAAATSTLADAAVRSALDQPDPEIDRLAQAVTDAAQERDRTAAAHRQAVTRATRLGALLEELATEVRAWDPVRHEHAVTAGLAALVEGKSGDNAWRMRLSAYVLSERLRQVVAAANERLGSMTDERYSLEQADERGAGEQRGGLSLRVRDQWSGKQRDPATLSGGETFLVSLALALGLADTVSHEAGGTQLDTLFIDEGFGALDATTLDGVMDTLDSLRDGGRVVGLVSHVPELRNRITTQLEVRKGRRGSTLAVAATA